jgi:hypothetical protein
VLKLIETYRSLQMRCVNHRDNAKDISDTHSKLQFWSIVAVGGIAAFFVGPLIGALSLGAGNRVALITPSHEIEKECDRMVVVANQHIKEIDERIEELKACLSRIGRSDQIPDLNLAN